VNREPGWWRLQDWVQARAPVCCARLANMAIEYRGNKVKYYWSVPVLLHKMLAHCERMLRFLCDHPTSNFSPLMVQSCQQEISHCFFTQVFFYSLLPCMPTHRLRGLWDMTSFNVFLLPLVLPRKQFVDSLKYDLTVYGTDAWKIYLHVWNGHLW
jgi:hypothetical protein